MMKAITTVGIDAHKKSCTACTFNNNDECDLDAKSGTFFDFPTTSEGVSSLISRIPEGSTIVVESSTTGRVLSRLLSGRYNIHMIAAPDRKPQVKTNQRDAERIVKEDMLGYLKRCYVPPNEIEVMRSLVAQQMQIGENISRVKSRVHSLIESNMVQSQFEGLSHIFSAEGLKRMSELNLPEHDMIALAMHLKELELYAAQHDQIEKELSKIVESDEECQLLMSVPGIAPFNAVAIKARIGDISRFPTKKHLSSYAGVVPRADNSGEKASSHNRVKEGDRALKYALTCTVRGAVKARATTSVKRFYLKQIRKGKAPQDAEVATARKLSWIVWKILRSKQRYIEEDKYLTKRKTRAVSIKAQRVLRNTVGSTDVSSVASGLASRAHLLERYP